MRALLAAACLLLAAVAVAPGAAASHINPPCDVIFWDPGPPPGWDTYCIVDRALAQVAHNVLATTECMAGYDPIIHGLGYLLDCTEIL